jgi:hypothetical protein
VILLGRGRAPGALGLKNIAPRPRAVKKCGSRRLSPERLENGLGVEGQAPDPLAGDADDGVGHRGGDRRQARLADPAERSPALENVDLVLGDRFILSSR